VDGDSDSIIQAVLNRDVDVAIVWGPLAGFYSHEVRNGLRVIPMVPDSDGEGLPFTFQISMGVRKGDDHLRMAVDEALERNKLEIIGVLNQFGVPQLSLTETGGGK
jgi:mxaJ protein